MPKDKYRSPSNIRYVSISILKRSCPVQTTLESTSEPFDFNLGSVGVGSKSEQEGRSCIDLSVVSILQGLGFRALVLTPNPEKPNPKNAKPYTIKP